MLRQPPKEQGHEKLGANRFGVTTQGISVAIKKTDGYNLRRNIIKVCCDIIKVCRNIVKVCCDIIIVCCDTIQEQA